MRKTGHGVGAAAYGALFILLTDKTCGRVEHHFQLIDGVRRILHDFGGDIELPDAVHVVGCSQMFSVQIEIRQSINPFKPKENTVGLPVCGLQREGRLVGKVIFHQLQRGQLVVTVKRVRDQILPKQRAVHGGGNLGADGCPGDVVHIFAENG